jgi:hypothetical protein
MAATKYKQYYQEMMDLHEDEFAKFQPIHDGYKIDRKKWSKQFHQDGQKLVDIIREWEGRLCAGMERGNNAVYSAKLSEKFWGEVKKRFSHIELVGVKSNLD